MLIDISWIGIDSDCLEVWEVVNPNVLPQRVAKFVNFETIQERLVERQCNMLHVSTEM